MTTHTVAAGFVNLEQQLTGLNLEALGWPVGATLGAALLVWITGYTRPIDVLLSILAASVLVGTVGYFYNGVVYGPRYAYEALPPLLIVITGGLTDTMQARAQNPDGARPRSTGGCSCRGTGRRSALHPCGDDGAAAPRGVLQRVHSAQLV